jgi:hypothetical protein
MLLFVLLLAPLQLHAVELMKDYFDYKVEQPLPTVSSDLIYGQGTTEITTQINDNIAIQPNQTIQGTLFVTHAPSNTIDENSFGIGNKPLKVSLVQNTQMSTGNIVVSIYQFQLEGLTAGTHTLPAIHVKVGDKEVQALPLTIEISQ